MTYLDFMTISGPATGSEVTYFDAIMTICPETIFKAWYRFKRV